MAESFISSWRPGHTERKPHGGVRDKIPKHTAGRPTSPKPYFSHLLLQHIHTAAMGHSALHNKHFVYSLTCSLSFSLSLLKRILHVTLFKNQNNLAFKNRMCWGVVLPETAHWSRTLASFTDNLSSVLSTHSVAHNCSYRGSGAFF